MLYPIELRTQNLKYIEITLTVSFLPDFQLSVIVRCSLIWCNLDGTLEYFILLYYRNNRSLNTVFIGGHDPGTIHLKGPTGFGNRGSRTALFAKLEA